MKFVILRHAERVDLVFGQQWIDVSFDQYGNYRRTNLNMPLKIVEFMNKKIITYDLVLNMVKDLSDDDEDDRNEVVAPDDV